MEFSIDKCVMFVVKTGKRHLMERMDTPNQDKIRTVGQKEAYKCLVILEADAIKQVQMKVKIQKKYLRRTWKLFETKLSNRKLTKELIPRLYPS